MKTSNERTQSIKEKVTAKRRNRKIIFTSAATACVLVALTVVCSLPILGAYAPSINAYKNDEYYPIIQKIKARYDEDRYSIFESLGQLGAVGDAATSEAPPSENLPTAEGSGSTNNGNKYEETTLNQVEGVIEGDILKRSTTHAFYLKNGYSLNSEPCLALDVYKLAGNDTEKVTEYFIRPKDNTSFSKYNSYIKGEMFLSSDAARATIIAPCLSEQSVLYTTVISLDISDVANIKEVNRVYVSGRFLSARKVDGKVLVVTNFTVGYYGYYYGQIDYAQKDTYVPRCGDMSASSYVPMQDIYVPQNCPNLSYTVLAMLDETTLNVADKYAVFSYTQDVAVFADKLVVTRNKYYYFKDEVEYGKEVEDPDYSSLRSYTGAQMSEMVVLNYVEGFEKVGAIGLDGYVKDRYSMDVKDNVLRVFTTVRHTPQWIGQYWTNPVVNVNLYCIDLSTMEIAASVKQFAPQGDEVKSVRYEGDVAYVCTARLNTDPVFYFDLSDYNNITYVDTGEIQGFSVNLIKFNGLLLGIGQGADRSILKVELYKQSDEPEAENGVVSVAKYEDFLTFSTEYKAHFVNAEHNLVGLQVYDYGYKYGDNWVTNEPQPAPGLRYLLLRYDEATQKFETAFFDYFDCGEDYARSFYEHNGVYVFGTNGYLFIDLAAK